jgi:hypothetical protein
MTQSMTIMEEDICYGKSHCSFYEGNLPDSGVIIDLIAVIFQDRVPLRSPGHVKTSTAPLNSYGASYRFIAETW